MSITTAMVMVAGTLSSAFPLFMPQTALAAGTVTVSGDTSAGENQAGWLFNRDTSTATPYEFNADARSLGVGSVYVKPIGSNASDKFIAENFLNLPVSSLKSISYDFKVGNAGIESSPYKDFYMSVYTNIDNSTNYYDCRFDYVPASGSLDTFTTAPFDATSAATAVTKRGTRITTACPATLSDMPSGSYVRVMALNVGQSTATDVGLSGYLDNVQVTTTSGTDISDFEPSPVLAAENFNTVNDASYKGVSVGFNAKDFGNVSAVTVEMTRTDDSTAVIRGTQDLFDLIGSNAAPYQFTAPFVIQPGSYNYAGDSYWKADPATWNTKTIPKSVTITITGANGTKTVTSSTFNQGTPSWPAYSSLVPTEAPTNLKFSYKDSNLADNNFSCGSGINSIKPTPYNKPGSLNLNWTAPAGDISSYQIRVTDPEGNQTIAYQGPNPYAWLQFNQGQGKYTYEVRTNSAAGLSGYSNPCFIYYDTTVPTAYFIKAPKDGASVNGKLTIEATAQDNVALKSLFVDVWTQNGATWKAGCEGTPTYSTDLKTASLTCTINTSGLVDGTTYMLRAHSGDYAGYGRVNTEAVRYITIDRTLPTVSITAPTGVVSGKTLTIKGSADDNADFNYYYCYVTLPGGREVGTRQPDCNTTWKPVSNGTLGNVDITGLADGNYQAHLVAYDKAGNSSDLNYSVPFVLDNTAPDAAITSPASGDTVSFAKDKTLQIRGTVTDVTPGRYYLRITGPNGYVSGPGTVNDPTAFTDKALYSWNLKDLTSGDYVIDLQSRDSAGNKDAGSSQKIHVTVDNNAPAAPTLVSPSDKAVVNGGSITQSWSGTDSSIDHYVYASYNNADATSLRYTANYSATSKTATNVAETTYWWRVKAVDAFGNESSWSDLRKLTVDNTGPATPVTDKASGDYQVAQMVGLSSSDANGSPAIYYTTDGSTPDDSSTLYTGAVLVSSDTTLKAIAYDTAGNASGVQTAVYTVTPENPQTINGSIGIPSNAFLNTSGLVQVTTFSAATRPLPSQTTVVETATGGDDTTGGVLGASTTEPNSNGEVKGNSTSSDTATPANSSVKQQGSFLGLGWWWLLVLAALMAVIYAVSRRSKTSG